MKKRVIGHTRFAISRRSFLLQDRPPERGGGGLFEVATPWNYCQGIYFASVLLDAASYVDGSIEEIRIRGADFSLPGRGLKVECSAGAGKCPPC